jgi:hypothetical protein
MPTEVIRPHSGSPVFALQTPHFMGGYSHSTPSGYFGFELIPCPTCMKGIFLSKDLRKLHVHFAGQATDNNQPNDPGGIERE